MTAEQVAALLALIAEQQLVIIRQKEEIARLRAQLAADRD